MKNFINKSPWISFFCSSDCNGCVLEVNAMLNPKYDIERFGCLMKASAKHADILLVAGIVNKHSKERLLQVYSQLPRPKVVIAVGSCAISGGLFKNAYNFTQPLHKIMPVTVFVPGCPPRPETIIDGLLKALKKKEEKHASKKTGD